MKKVLFCRVAYMKWYDDAYCKEPLFNGGSYTVENETGGEINNFRLYEDKYYYGYVATGFLDENRKQFNIEKIGGCSKKDDCISGVTVVFCAPVKGKGNVIVGWYKNATVYSKMQRINGKLYNIVTEKGNAFLVDSERRSFYVPNARKGKPGMGESQVWYADKDTREVKKIVNDVLRYIKIYNDIDPYIYSDTFGEVFFESGLPGERNIKAYERNIKARKACLELKGYRCSICGFDAKEVYGEEFTGKIHVHHIEPISQRNDVYSIDPEKDLMPVCPNCHMALHTKVNGHCLSPEDLKKRYEKMKKENTCYEK